MNKDKYSFELPKSAKEYIELDIKIRLACTLICFVIGFIVGLINVLLAKSWLEDIPYETILEKPTTNIELYKNYNIKTNDYQIVYIVTHNQIIVRKSTKKKEKIYKITDDQLRRLKKMFLKCPMERFKSKMIYQPSYLCIVDGAEVYPLKLQYNIIDIETYIKNIIQRNTIK